MRPLQDSAYQTMLPTRGPAAELVVADPRRRRQLEAVLDRPADGVGEVRVIDLDGDAPVPGDVAGGLPTLVLSDDPVLAADPRIAGVLPREAPLHRIVAAVAAIAAGLHVREPAAERVVVPVVAPVLPSVVTPVLTPREREILGLVGEGASNKVIARRLGISAHTVKYHLEAVFTKLGVNSRAEALSQGLRRGVVTL